MDGNHDDRARTQADGLRLNPELLYEIHFVGLWMRILAYGKNINLDGPNLYVKGVRVDILAVRKYNMYFICDSGLPDEMYEIAPRWIFSSLPDVACFCAYNYRINKIVPTNIDFNMENAAEYEGEKKIVEQISDNGAAILTEAVNIAIQAEKDAMKYGFFQGLSARRRARKMRKAYEFLVGEFDAKKIKQRLF